MNMREPDERVRFDNADIIFKHFGGEKDDFHTEGQRDFAIRIDEEEAHIGTETRPKLLREAAVGNIAQWRKL